MRQLLTYSKLFQLVLRVVGIEGGGLLGFEGYGGVCGDILREGIIHSAN